MKIDVLNLCLKILPSTEYCTLSYYYWLSTTERGRGKKKIQGSEIGHRRQINEKAAVFFYY